MDKLLRSPHLYKALSEAGICSITYAPKWFKHQEDNGCIKYPRQYNNEARKFTQKQINDIVAAFRPEGKQSWKL